LQKNSAFAETFYNISLLHYADTMQLISLHDMTLE